MRLFSEKDKEKVKEVYTVKILKNKAVFAFPISSASCLSARA
jgi:hypothetical protein